MHGKSSRNFCFVDSRTVQQPGTIFHSLGLDFYGSARHPVPSFGYLCRRFRPGKYDGLPFLALLSTAALGKSGRANFNHSLLSGRVVAKKLT